MVPAKKSTTDVDLGKIRLTATGIEFLAVPSLDEWRAAFQWVKRCEGAVQFWLGDLVLAGESMFGEEASQEFDRETIRRWVWVCDKVNPDVRRQTLTFSHHEAVAHLEPREQRRWLELAESMAWSSKELRRQLKDTKNDAESKQTCPTCGKSGWDGVYLTPREAL